MANSSPARAVEMMFRRRTHDVAETSPVPLLIYVSELVTGAAAGKKRYLSRNGDRSNQSDPITSLH